LSTEPPRPDGDATTADGHAWRSLLQTLIPIALQQLQEGFGLRALRVPDARQAEAALWSACSSFQRHSRDGEFADAAGPEELAAHLLRIAGNRAQRRRRRDGHIRDELRHGTARDSEGQPVPRDHPDDSPGPDQQVIQSELTAYLREAIDSIKEELQGRRNALEIVQAYLEDMERSQADIAAALGINQSTVSRWICWFQDRIRQMLEEGGMA